MNSHGRQLQENSQDENKWQTLRRERHRPA